MEFDPTHQLPAAADLDERSISVGVMSKAYGMPGLRIGWVASRDSDLLRRIARIKDHMSPSSSTPSEILALIALRAHEDVVARCKKIVTDNIAHVESFFARWHGLFDWSCPQGSPVGFPRLNAPTPVDGFVAELVKQEGVLLLPATIFDYPENRFRVGLGKRSLPEAVERLDNFVDRKYAHFR
jgi:aspartate/methionine/tyrosine aminotransferase